MGPGTVEMSITEGPPEMLAPHLKQDAELGPNNRRKHEPAAQERGRCRYLTLCPSPAPALTTPTCSRPQDLSIQKKRGSFVCPGFSAQAGGLFAAYNVHVHVHVQR